MDSINQQQPERNRKNLQDEEAVKKIQELVGKGSTCFFCTHLQATGPFSTRPMSIQQVDDEGNLWFLIANDSSTYKELREDNRVQLNLQGSAHSDFFTLYGTVTLSQDRQKIEELWEPVIKTWFTGGKDDARIAVVKVTPQEGYYWDTKNGNLVAGVKVLIGALTGQTLDDSIEGTLKV